MIAYQKVLGVHVSHYLLKESCPGMSYDDDVFSLLLLMLEILNLGWNWLAHAAR